VAVVVLDGVVEGVSLVVVGPVVVEGALVVPPPPLPVPMVVVIGDCSM
jgi:hypothetical protein